MSFDLSFDGAGNPATTLRVYLLQSGTPKDVWLPVRGTPFNPETCNLGSADASRTLEPLVNEWVVQGAPLRVEASLLLYPLFPSQASDSASPTAIAQFLATNDGGEENTYRLFGFNEAGDGYYAPGSSTPVLTVPSTGSSARRSTPGSARTACSRSTREGLLAVAFTHRDSRAGDPDLHTHVAISNKVQTTGGRWLALDGRPLHRAAVAASERYNTRLEAMLTARLGLRFADRPDESGKRPVREIVGVDPALGPVLVEAPRRHHRTAAGARGGVQPHPRSRTGLRRTDQVVRTREHRHPAGQARSALRGRATRHVAGRGVDRARR